MVVERKKFQLLMGGNPRGAFLRITAEVSGRCHSIVVSLSGVGEFAAALAAAVLESQRQAGAATRPRRWIPAASQTRLSNGGSFLTCPSSRVLLVQPVPNAVFTFWRWLATADLGFGPEWLRTGDVRGFVNHQHGFQVRGNSPQQGKDRLVIRIVGEAENHRRRVFLRICSAKMGVFQITPVTSTAVSDYGVNDTSSLEKKVTAVVSATFAIE